MLGPADPIGALGTAADVAPLAKRAFDVLVGRGSVAKLTRHVAANLERSSQIAQTKRKQVAETWTTKHADPDLVGALTSWLASGDETFVARALERWRELLRFDSQLELTDDEVITVCAVTAASLRANFARAQPDEIAAIHAEAERTRHKLDATREELLRGFAEIVSQLVSDAQAQRPPRRVRFNLQAQPVAAVFRGRGRDLDAIAMALASDDRAVVTQAIAGLGGVGKTQLAARYVQLHADEYEIIAWIKAQDGGVADLADLADHLRIVNDPELAPAERAQRAIGWLNECEDKRGARQETDTQQRRGHPHFARPTISSAVSGQCSITCVM